MSIHTLGFFSLVEVNPYFFIVRLDDYVCSLWLIIKVKTHVSVASGNLRKTLLLLHLMLTQSIFVQVRDEYIGSILLFILEVLNTTIILTFIFLSSQDTCWSKLHPKILIEWDHVSFGICKIFILVKSHCNYIIGLLI